jgi:hypothetical protein
MSPTQVRLFEAGTLIAVHPLLEGRHQRSLLRGHRSVFRTAAGTTTTRAGVTLTRPGQRVARRPLAIYASIGQRLAQATPVTGGMR